MFTVITWHEGVRYDYVVHKGSKSPAIELLSTQDEYRENGTEVIVTIKDYEEGEFKAAIRTQLQFFDKITFINCDYQPPEIKKFKNFVYTSKEGGRNLHVVMGKVVYPVKSDVVEKIMSDLNYSYSYTTQYSNFYLYFDIGDLDLVWTREALNYSPKTIKAISDKLEAARNEIGELIDKTPMTFEDALKVNKDSFNITIAGQSLTVEKTNYLFTNIKWSNLVNDIYQKYAIEETEIPVLKGHYKYYKTSVASLNYTISKKDLFKISDDENKFIITSDKINSDIKDYLLYVKGVISTYKFVKFDKFLTDNRNDFAKFLDIEANQNDPSNPYTADELGIIYSFAKTLYGLYKEVVENNLKKIEDQTPSEQFLKLKAEENERLKNISSWNFTKYNFDWGINVQGQRHKFNYNKSLPLEENLKLFRDEVIGYYNLSKNYTYIVIYDSQKYKDRITTVAKEYMSYSNLNIVGFTCNKNLAKLLEKHDNHQFIRASNANSFFLTKRIAKNKQRATDIKTIREHSQFAPTWLHKQLILPNSLINSYRKVYGTYDLEGALKREPDFATEYFKQLGICERYNYIKVIENPTKYYGQNDVAEILKLLEKPKYKNVSDELVGKLVHRKLQQQKQKNDENISAEKQQCSDSNSGE